MHVGTYIYALIKCADLSKIPKAWYLCLTNDIEGTEGAEIEILAIWLQIRRDKLMSLSSFLSRLSSFSRIYLVLIPSILMNQMRNWNYERSSLDNSAVFLTLLWFTHQNLSLICRDSLNFSNLFLSFSLRLSALVLHKLSIDWMN